MATVSTSGIEELFEDMSALAEIPDEVLTDMLVAQADVIAAAQAQEARAMLSGEFSQGITAGSITFDRKLKVKGPEKCIYVYPKGTRRDGNRRSVSEVAFINEFGKAGQPGRPFINVANEKKASEAVDAAARVYDEFLKKKNL